MMTWDFLLSGGAHVYYGLFAVIGSAIAVLLGAPVAWLFVALIAAGGIFSDLWAHGYQH